MIKSLCNQTRIETSKKKFKKIKKYISNLFLDPCLDADDGGPYYFYCFNIDLEIEFSKKKNAEKNQNLFTENVKKIIQKIRFSLLKSKIWTKK